MTKVIRINDETVRLLEQYKNNLNKQLNKSKIEYIKDVLSNNNVVLQSALRIALSIDHFVD